MAHPERPSKGEILERMVLTTGSDEEAKIIAARDEFFMQITDAFGLRIPGPFVEINSKALGFEEPNSFRASDDVIHSLIVRDQLVAVCIDRRNNFNMHEVTFFIVGNLSKRLEEFLASTEEAKREMILKLKR